MPDVIMCKPQGPVRASSLFRSIFTVRRTLLMGHMLLLLYATAAIILAVGTIPSLAETSKEFWFSLGVAFAMGVGSGTYCISLLSGRLYGIALFFCALFMLLCAALPFMMSAGSWHEFTPVFALFFWYCFSMVLLIRRDC